MNNIYLASDFHFGHSRMVQYCDRPLDFSERIFDGLQTIPADDHLICLGDVCVGRDKEMHERFIAPLKCRKSLVLGNHDKKTRTWYLSHGWDEVEKRIIIDIGGGKRALLTHEFDQYLDNISINLAGHLHNHLERILAGRFVIEGEEERNAGWLSYYNPKKHILVSMEELNYKPIELTKFLETHL